MGIQDFSGIFDVLDPSCLGYLTTQQLHQFYESLHFSTIDINHVSGALGYVYGSNSEGLVTKDKFLNVLQEIDRRRQVEEQVRWDFQALDRTGSYLISVPDALLLFRNTQGEHFSMNTWRQFLASRESETRDVSFDELRLWLCDLPADGSADGDLDAEEKRLAEVQREQTTKEHDDYKKTKGENESAQQKDENQMKAKRGMRRKLNRLETDGLEAFLYDDGVDRGEQLSSTVSNTISVTDLLDKLDIKYDLIRTKLFWEMIRKESSNGVLSDVDQVDTFQQLQAEERQMRRDDTLVESGHKLTGAGMSHSLQLVGLMGGVGKELSAVLNDVNEQRVELQGEGKEEAEVEKALRVSCERRFKGPASSSELLVALHARWQAEREEVLARLRSAAPAASKLGQALVEFSRLERQQAVLDLEEEFQTAATSAGLAERAQPPKYIRFNPDRLGQERLASDRLRQRKGRKLKLPVVVSSAMVEGSSMMELVSMLTKEVCWKQAQEREVMVQLLTGRDAASAKAASRQLSAAQCHHKKTSLRNQRLAWRSSNAQYRNTHKQQQTIFLQEGAGLYYETVRAALGGSDNALCAAVLADLQQAQDAEFQELLTSLYGKSEKEMRDLILVESSSRTEEHLDTLARLLLGVFEVRTDEKPLLAALDAKYDALRHVLLLQAVKEELGLAWTRLSSDERQRHLVKKKNEELRLRQEGRFEEMVQLITKIPQDMGSLRSLMGEDREEFSRRQKVQAEKKDQAAVQGQATSLVESDETPADHNKTSNVLGDLLQRYYVEQDFVISWYRSPDIKAKGQAYLNILQVLLQLETSMCEREDSFALAAITVGLTERIEAATERRHPSDRQRQSQLSAARTDARRQRMEKGLHHRRELDEYAKPEKGDLVAWMESFLREQNKKHAEEREMLLGVLQDPGLEELVEVARTMPSAERTSRLAELRVKHNKIDIENPDQREENYSIIEESAAIRCVIKRDHMESTRNEVRHRDVTAEILAELQDEQDRELAGYIAKIPNMDYEELKKCREYEINARHWGAGDNVVHVLTRHEGEAEDDELLAALDDKYDALRDKLLSELLMKQVGEDEWARLSEQERQRRLIQLKLKEKRLRRDGNLDELAKLFGDNMHNEDALRNMMGDNRAEYDRKLKERLARRQKRIDEGLDPDDEEEDLEEEDSSTTANLLDDLQARYQAEKEALLRQMRGLDAKHLSERERQAELLRLKREARRAEREDNFGNAARLIGLAERQQGELSEKLKNDRLRQEQLAKERLKELKRRRGEKQEVISEEVLREGTKGELQDAVMKRLDERHISERELLVHFLSNLDPDSELRLIAMAMSPMEREEKLDTLKEKRIDYGLKATVDNHNILQEACVVKFERRRMLLTAKSGDDVTDDEVIVSLLADLQEAQEKEAEAMLNDVLEKEVPELVEMQIRVIELTKQQRADNIATVLFAPEKESPNELLDALDSKYDALRDKLLAEALMKEAGEAEWNMLSEGERQRRMAELKLKERQLRRQGKNDEAAALLGDALKDHETLQALMGNAREDQERRLKERLERRRQRQAEGMSEEECQRLEQEEIAAEEEEEKKKRNVLLDLMKNYDDERDALLRGLRDNEDKVERERLRQQALARLRREQRRAKTEEKYDAAAIVLGLAQKQEDSAEAERLRQEQLAKERLAARRAARLARQAGAGAEDEQVVVVAPTDDKDLVGLQDAVLQETELKHKAEREALLQLLEEENEGVHREAARTLSAEHRLDRQEELRQRRALWREQPDADNQQQDQLLREGAGVCLEITSEKLASEGKDNSADALQIFLLADLQQSQEHEMRVLSNTLSKADAETLREVKVVQAEARRKHFYDNMAGTLLGRDALPGDDGLSAGEQEAITALQKKYDAARDKLLIQALMKEAGEKEWASMTRAEQQRRLVRMRLEERRLRREGKYDEAEALLGQLNKDNQALQDKLGASKSEQKKSLEERLRRRAELKAEREANGLGTDELLLDAIVDQEMVAAEQAKKKNILESLEHHFEDEKEALLAALRSQDSREQSERQRQLQIARLRREQKMMEKEDKFDSAAILISMAKRNEGKLEESFASEQDRQRQLARERLAARRLKRAAAGGVNEEEERLKDAEEKLKAALDSSTQNTDDVMVLSVAVLDEMESKHGRERDALMDLLSNIQSNPDALNAARNLGEQEAKMELEQFRVDRVRWQKESRKISTRLSETDGVTDTEKANLRKSLEDGKKEQQNDLLSALAIKLNLEVEALRKQQPDLSEKDVLEEAGVTVLTDLQQKQTAENSAMEKVLPQQAESMLMKLKETQRHSKTCDWYENLTNAICTLPSHDLPLDEPLPNQEALVQTLDEELEKEKEDYINKLRKERPGEEIDVDAALKELEAQHLAKRKALHEAMDKQQRQLKARLEAKRRARDAAEYEEEAAVALVRNAEREQSFVLEKKQKEKARQQDLMAQRLAARREARRLAQESESFTRESSGVFSDVMSEASSRGHTPSLPGGRMRREKTALDVEVTEDQKKELFSRVVRENADWKRKISADQQRQQDQLQRRRRDISNKRQEEADALFSLGMRQKTILEKTKQEELDRQKTAVKERIARVRYERTMTMKDIGDKKARKFDELVKDQGSEGMTENEKMALAAKRMEKQFMESQRDRQPTQKEEEEEGAVGGASDAGQTTATTGRLLTREDKMALLKQRRLEKKRQRQEQEKDAE